MTVVMSCNVAFRDVVTSTNAKQILTKKTTHLCVCAILYYTMWHMERILICASSPCTCTFPILMFCACTLLAELHAWNNSHTCAATPPKQRESQTTNETLCASCLHANATHRVRARILNMHTHHHHITLVARTVHKTVQRAHSSVIASDRLRSRVHCATSTQRSSAPDTDTGHS